MTRLFSKRLVLIAPVLLLLAAAVIVAPRLLSEPLQISISTGAAVSAAGEHEQGKPDDQEATLPTVPITTRERIVNLADKGAYRYLKVEIVLDVAVPDARRGDEPPRGEEIKKMQERLDLEMAGIRPRMDDAITTILSSKTSEELMTVEGKQRLRDELRAQLDRVSEFPIMGVYFTTFIIQ